MCTYSEINNITQLSAVQRHEFRSMRPLKFSKILIVVLLLTSGSLHLIGRRTCTVIVDLILWLSGKVDFELVSDIFL